MKNKVMSSVCFSNMYVQCTHMKPPWKEAFHLFNKHHCFLICCCVVVCLFVCFSEKAFWLQQRYWEDILNNKLTFKHAIPPQSQKTERHVFLLDGLAICCKQIRGRVGEYRLKEKINTRKVKLIDMEDADGKGEGANEDGRNGGVMYKEEDLRLSFLAFCG